MNSIHLLPIGDLDLSLLDHLRKEISAEFRLPCVLSSHRLDPRFAYQTVRQQYHATEILARLRDSFEERNANLLGVTRVDLFIPILTFVFGEAQLGGTCALVSAHRLFQEFYGLPRDDDLLRLRLAKEAIHELGHTMGLTHCADYSCVMAASNSVEWIDIKRTAFCGSCRQHVALR